MGEGGLLYISACPKIKYVPYEWGEGAVPSPHFQASVGGGGGGGCVGRLENGHPINDYTDIMSAKSTTTLAQEKLFYFGKVNK